jgi:hypothetical protein
MLRRLLNIASIVCLILCAALMGMWVRSYRWKDEFRGRASERQALIAVSIEGRLLSGKFQLPKLTKDWPWLIHSIPVDDQMRSDWDMAHGSPGSPARLGLEVYSAMDNFSVTLPYWFLVLTTGSLAMAFRLRWPLRFTLRSLFVATTFLAVVLGMIAWLDRAWIGK